MPHTPLFRAKAFEGKSLRGVYGDVIEEIDWSVGRVLDTLREEGLAENTLVLFTSDNGPWLIFGRHGGSAGLLREGKGSTWEGGMREPALFWWPGKILPGVVRQMGSTLDVLPTVARLAGAAVPSDRPIDGYDLSGVLFGEGKSPAKRCISIARNDCSPFAAERSKRIFGHKPATPNRGLLVTTRLCFFISNTTRASVTT